MKNCILIALLLLGLNSVAQIPANFPELVLSEVNRVRDSVGVKPLNDDATLAKAAAIQVEWCRKNGDLSHYQKKSRRLYEPFNRVFAVNGHHEGIAENLLYTFPKSGQSSEMLAREVVWIWVHSPGHFKNMVEPVSRLSGLGFAFDPKSSRLYACQVFATSEWVIPPHLKVNKRAYRIKPKQESCCAGLEQFSGREREFAYGFSYAAPKPGEEFGKVYFRHDDASLVQTMLTNPKGAVASDIVFRSQFPCCSPNTLHGSPYHDGYLQKPRTWKYLSKHNIPDSLRPEQIWAQTAKVPDLGTGEFQTNVVITKARHFCKYAFPVTLMQGNLGPFSFELPPDTVPFRNEELWKRRSVEFIVPFAKGDARVDKSFMKPILDSLKVPGTEVMGLHIRGFASIEGPIEINQGLYDNRANNILKIVQAHQKKEIHLVASAAENWPDFRRDVKNTSYKWMLKLTSEAVRDTLAKDKALLAELEPLLGPHRYARVEIDLRFPTPIRPLTNAELADSLEAAVSHKWYYHAHRMQSEMIRRYLRDEMDPQAILNTQFPISPRTIALIHNQHWLKERLEIGLSLPISDVLLDSSGTYPWFHVRNLLLTTKWMAFGFLDKKLTAQKVYSRIQTLKDDTRVSKAMTDVLELNYYIGIAKMSGANAKLLANIQTRYAGDTVDVYEAVKLGLFYNSLLKTGETIGLLRPFIQKRTVTEEIVFLWAWTAAIRLDLVPESEWLDWMDEARAINPDRWHKMVDTDWQLLRWERIKGQFCDCAVELTSSE